MINLKNVNVILTGATGGIGSAILDKLYSTNAKILATGTNQSKLDNINQKYENVITKKFDISNHALIEEFINECNDQLENKIDVNKLIEWFILNYPDSSRKLQKNPDFQYNIN